MLIGYLACDYNNIYLCGEKQSGFLFLCDEVWLKYSKVTTKFGLIAFQHRLCTQLEEVS